MLSSSSVRLRGWSTVRVASGAICVAVLFIGVAYIHTVFSYTIFYHREDVFLYQVAIKLFTVYGTWFFGVGFQLLVCLFLVYSLFDIFVKDKED